MNSKDKKKELRKITAAGVSIMTVALLFSSIFRETKLKELLFGQSLLKYMTASLPLMRHI